MSDRPRRHGDVEALVDRILAEVGPEIGLGLPLGLGKANHVANALFRRAAADPSIRLRIFTALTLEQPAARSEFERRFLEPLNERLFADYPELEYARALRQGRLPANVEVHEFFLLAGRWLGVAAAQQGYISANYTHAARAFLDRGLNVVAQLVARQDESYSLSCNPDITLDILPELERRGGCLVIGQVNAELPFMGGDAALPAAAFTDILEAPAYEFPLYGLPKSRVSDADFAAGIHVAALLPDGGTLQIGIGSLGDAVTHALILRQRDIGLFRQTLERLGSAAEVGPFERGLYGASEMFVDGFLELYRAGILKRPAEDGALLHAGFFLAGREFYKALREMPPAERELFRMTAISFINELYGDEARKRRERVGARFVNNAMMVTLLGAVVSDGLESGQVVSGVGGQYNFVAQAFALDDARSIITLAATREAGGRTVSNLIWNYGHTTIPRHLRDLVVTEYGVAALRGESDRDCVAAMLRIADARYQDALLAQAVRAGKIERGFRIERRDNVPERIHEALAPARAKGWFRPYPFGTAFTPVEQRLIPALQSLKAISGSRWRLAHSLLRGLRAPEPAPEEAEALARMGLERPTGLKERFYRALLRSALQE